MRFFMKMLWETRIDPKNGISAILYLLPEIVKEIKVIE